MCTQGSPAFHLLDFVQPALCNSSATALPGHEAVEEAWLMKMIPELALVDSSHYCCGVAPVLRTPPPHRQMSVSSFQSVVVR